MINPSPDQDIFDIDNFVRKSFTVNLSSQPRVSTWCSYSQTLKKNKVPDPGIDKICTFITRICDSLRLNSEFVIIALIYIERLMEEMKLNLSARNWIPVLSIALIEASKIWDDHSTWNSDFAEILPFFTVEDINLLERQFLSDLDYKLKIDPSDYARYYFGLRALRRQRVQRIPKYYLKLNLGGAGRVGEKTNRAENDLFCPMSL